MQIKITNRPMEQAAHTRDAMLHGSSVWRFNGYHEPHDIRIEEISGTRHVSLQRDQGFARLGHFEEDEDGYTHFVPFDSDRSGQPDFEEATLFKVFWHTLEHYTTLVQRPERIL